MDEIEAVEWMVLVLDAAVHMDAAIAASIPLNDSVGIDHAQLVAICHDAELVPRDDSDHRKERSFRLPTLRAAANVIVRALGAYLHLHGVGGALAGEGTAGKVLDLDAPDSAINRRVN